jgi:hypothetical protein
LRNGKDIDNQEQKRPAHFVTLYFDVVYLYRQKGMSLDGACGWCR